MVLIVTAARGMGEMGEIDVVFIRTRKVTWVALGEMREEMIGMLTKSLRMGTAMTTAGASLPLESRSITPTTATTGTTTTSTTTATIDTRHPTLATHSMLIMMITTRTMAESTPTRDTRNTLLLETLT
jgi:hypothetical protein